MIRNSRLWNLCGPYLINRINRPRILIGQCKIIDSIRYPLYYSLNRFVSFGDIQRRLYSGGNGGFQRLDDDYYLRKNGSEGGFYLGATKEKFKDFKEIVYINFTDEREVKRGDYLFSVEDSKTLFDFYSPVDCTVEEINPKFQKCVNEQVLKDLFESPEEGDNYLVRVRLRGN